MFSFFFKFDGVLFCWVSTFFPTKNFCFYRCGCCAGNNTTYNGGGGMLLGVSCCWRNGPKIIYFEVVFFFPCFACCAFLVDSKHKEETLEN